MKAVNIEVKGPVFTVILHRPHRRNAIDPATATLLQQAFEQFEKDENALVAVLYGSGGHFCAGADLQDLAEWDESKMADRLSSGEAAPLGPTHMQLSKPVIAAVSGYAVAGGLELALWCDLRVLSQDAVFGVFCRRFGVPLIDGGTVRLPRLIGQSRALDMILTGRPVRADEALHIGLANRLVPEGQVRAEAERLAHEIAAFPQLCMRHDRASVYAQAGMPLAAALQQETEWGRKTLASGESLKGARRFAKGQGRGGSFA